MTQAGTTTATATKDAVTGDTHFITHISGHGDKDTTVQILGGSAGTTVLAEIAHDTTLSGYQLKPLNGLWIGTTGVAVAVKITTATADCQINVCGFTVG